VKNWSIYPTLEKIHFDNAILEELNPQIARGFRSIEWSDIGAWEAQSIANQQ
jgi:mannose-1-phosphate guanylyltransferase